MILKTSPYTFLSIYSKPIAIIASAEMNHMNIKSFKVKELKENKAR